MGLKRLDIAQPPLANQLLDGEKVARVAPVLIRHAKLARLMIGQ
jgi:hypothetical protein